MSQILRLVVLGDGVLLDPNLPEEEYKEQAILAMMVQGANGGPLRIDDEITVEGRQFIVRQGDNPETNFFDRVVGVYEKVA